MVTRILSYRYIQYFLSTLIVLGATICIFTPNYFLFKMGSQFAVKIMLGYLFLGLIFLLFKQPKLTFTSFACCAGLCLFLKSSTNADMKAPVITNEEVVNVAHFNLSTSGDDYQRTIQQISDSNADLISIQELTPDWLPVINMALKEKYPYSSAIVRMDPYGMAVFSKMPFVSLDTFYYNDIPNLAVVIRSKEGNQPLAFIVAHTTPPLYSSAHGHMQAHLKEIANYISDIQLPIITLGDFYAPPWWKEIQDLKTAAYLNDSRSTARLSMTNIFENPVDYIFHSDQLNCIDFKSINNANADHIGIQGVYQFNPTEVAAN